jgi:hypothetical protein
MKRLTTALFLLFIATLTFSQTTVQPKVDERTELLSIVFRLAGASEYVNNNIPTYSNDIDNYFTAFKNHEAILYAQKVRKENGVGYDAVMSLAVLLEISDSVRINPNVSLSTLDNRWTTDKANTFTRLLNQFYFDTKFKDFFLLHKPLYKIAEDKFSVILNKVDFGWFEKFYGEKPKGNFNLILSIPNGGGNYGPKVILNDGREDLFAIIGSCLADSLGLPFYSDGVRSIVVHEYNHSFCNPLMLDNFPAMQAVSDKFYELVKDKMSAQAYGYSKTMNCEILVRACVIKYFQRKKENDKYIKPMIVDEQSKGFLWIEQLFNELTIYEKNRDKYPVLKDFMLEIVKLQNDLSPEKIFKQIDLNNPKIISISIENNSQNVDPGTIEIILNFDRPMSILNNGIGYGKLGKDYFPEFPKERKAKWNTETKKQWIIPISLKPLSTYSLSFPAQFFADENGNHLDKIYFLDFKTTK